METTSMGSRDFLRMTDVNLRSVRRSSVLAGPMIWYALAGLSVLLSLYLFLTAGEVETVVRQHAIAIFIGLWAPMFAILGLRAEVLDIREGLSKKKRR